MIRISEEYCKGCGYCVFACPTDALKISSKINFRGVSIPLIDEKACKMCRLCEMICPDFAIVVEEE
ncbi:MAG: 4Fe-4S dicluster domain-containing protein [Candidatus Methanofastidiosia archaeon]